MKGNDFKLLGGFDNEWTDGHLLLRLKKACLVKIYIVHIQNLYEF